MPETPDEVRAIAERVGRRRLRRVQARLGAARAATSSTTRRSIRAARDELGPERELMIDGGQAYTVKQATELLRRVEDARLYWLEEPLAPDDYDGYRRLSDAVTTRIAAGEADSTIGPVPAPRRATVTWTCSSPTSPAAAASPSRDRSPQLARERRVEVVPHCFSTGVLVAASLHFAATLDRPTYSEFSVADSPLAGGLLAAAVRARGRYARRSDRPRPRDRARRGPRRPAADGLTMAAIEFEQRDEALPGRHRRGRRHQPRRRRRRVHDPRRPVGLREDDGAADGRRARGDHVRGDPSSAAGSSTSSSRRSATSRWSSRTTRSTRT